MLGLLLLVAEAALPTPAPVQCEIVMTDREEGQLLFGMCGKAGVLIGSATKYETAINASTGVATAIIHRGDDVRVVMVCPGEGDSAYLEDVTPDLARLGGRIPSAGLHDMDVDLSRFATDATVGVAMAGKDGAAPSKLEGEVSARTILANEAARQALPHEESPVDRAIRAQQAKSQ
jgi:hypothetical protein